MFIVLCCLMLQVNKAMQIYETQTVRWTTQVVGPTGGGKTLNIDALAWARGPAQGVNVKQWIINPKVRPTAATAAAARHTATKPLPHRL
jgi:hypothetical protein